MAVKELFRIIKIILLLEIFSWILWRIVDFCANYFQSRVIADLSNDCFAYLHKHSFNYFTNNFSGSLVKKVKWFASAFENIADRILWNFLPLTVTIIFTTAVLLKVNIWLGAGVFTWVMMFLTVNFLFTKYKLKYDIQRSEAETAATGLLADTIINHNNVKLFNGYLREVKRFAGAIKKLQEIRLFSWNLHAAFFALQALIWIVLEIGLYVFAIYLWKRNSLSVGGFMLIQVYVLNIFSKVWDFSRNIQRLYESLADAEEMTIILNTPHEIKNIRQAKELVVSEGDILFKDVFFNYNFTRAVIKNFNLKINPKENVALVGSSGAGKTTIIKLFFRIYDLTAGKILIDGQNIVKVTQESLWKNISLVPQDPILFHRSLIENIRYGRLEATDKEVVRAAKLAHCHDFILQTPDGYDTFVGERGIKLSGGERQRVAIARAILKNSPILVLDEATSSLDSESKQLIQGALNNLMKDKTVIVIAHRLSTIQKADRIIVIEDGKIAEAGRHNLLLKKRKGEYAKMWQLQVRGFIGNKI